MGAPCGRSRSSTHRRRGTCAGSRAGPRPSKARNRRESRAWAHGVRRRVGQNQRRPDGWAKRTGWLSAASSRTRAPNRAARGWPPCVRERRSCVRIRKGGSASWAELSAPSEIPIGLLGTTRVGREASTAQPSVSSWARTHTARPTQGGSDCCSLTPGKSEEGARGGTRGALRISDNTHRGHQHGTSEPPWLLQDACNGPA